MPYGDIRPFSAPLGGHTELRYAPMNAAEVFQFGDLVFVNTDGELAQFPRDGTEALVADVGTGALLVGVAAFGPGTTVTAELTGTRAWTDPRTGLAFATGARCAYYPADQGNLFYTDNSVIAAGGGAGAAPNGADRGVAYQLTYVSGTTPDLGWGVELTAGVYGTDIVAKIVDVLDANFQPVGATAAGVYFVFEIKTAA